MKKLIVIAGLLLTSLSLKAEVSCITNILIVITNSSAYMSGGTNMMQTSGNELTVMLYYPPCASGGDVPIGFATIVCDTSIQCGINEGGGSKCAAGNTYTVYMPTGTFKTTARFYSRYGCCSLYQDNFNGAACTVGGGCP